MFESRPLRFAEPAKPEPKYPSPAALADAFADAFPAAIQVVMRDNS
jgi:hypothetical protein